MSFRELLSDSRLERFYDYWRALRAGRPMPARRDLDPADIKDLLPHIVVVPQIGERFLYRLVGTEVVIRIGAENTGRYFDELRALGGYREFMARVYRMVCDDRRAVLSEIDYDGGATAAAIRRLSVPFSDDGAAVSHVVSLLLFQRPKGAAPVMVGDEERPSSIPGLEVAP
jgi:hypothetical protein